MAAQPGPLNVIASYAAIDVALYKVLMAAMEEKLHITAPFGCYLEQMRRQDSNVIKYMKQYL